MINPGPILEELTHRLSETPVEFLGEPRIGATGTVMVAALVHDLCYQLGARAPVKFLVRFHGSTVKADRNRLALAMIASWLMSHPWFTTAQLAQHEIAAVLTDAISELAAAGPAHKFVSDADRREELARVVLARLGYRPAGETLEQASDRLSSISVVERRRLLQASRESEQRAREIRAALATKAAEESADKWSRE